MTTKTLNGKTILIAKVPEDATDFWINRVGCIRYSIGKLSSVIEPTQIGEYLTEAEWSILGRAKDISLDKWYVLFGVQDGGHSWLKAEGIKETDLLIIKNNVK